MESVTFHWKTRPTVAGTRKGAGRGHRGFTLIDVMLTVVILGILASFVMPQVATATRQTREVTLADTARFMRGQLEIYKAQHRDTFPGYLDGNVNSMPTEPVFVLQLLGYTDEYGHVSSVPSGNVRRGPYLSKMPVNPINGLTSVRMVANGQAPPAPDNSTGWTYRADTGAFLVNSTGTDRDGVRYADY